MCGIAENDSTVLVMIRFSLSPMVVNDDDGRKVAAGAGVKDYGQMFECLRLGHETMRKDPYLD